MSILDAAPFPMPGHTNDQQTLNCKIVAYNFGPKGGVEGLLVEAGGKPAQIACPPEKSAELARTNPIGQTVDMHVAIEPPSPKRASAHPVYHLLAGLPSEKSCGTAASRPQSTAGVVARLNFARHVEATRIIGEMRKLGINGISRQSVRNILKEEGIVPAPDRTSDKSENFLERHRNTLWAVDSYSTNALHGVARKTNQCSVATRFPA
jgi:hypothetical protein